MIAKVGIVGAGTMGAGIAFVTAGKLDAPVIIRDVSEDMLARGRSSVQKYAARAVERKAATQDEADRWLSRISYTTNMEDLAGCSFVVEAVYENLNLKKEIFSQLEAVCPPDAILATNTSGLPVTQIAAATKSAGRVLGVHFFNPVPAMKLVELVRGYETTDATLDAAMSFCRDLGKEVIVARDYPGFITTRIGVALLCEGIRCLEAGVGSVEDIDKGMKLAYNHPMGPFELADLIGLDVCLMIMESLQREVGDQFRPSPLLRQMVAAGHLGRKSGGGFHIYSGK